ncbi:MAG: hypothetical protein AAGI38_25155, partial [Bacteroidota bacterium]
LYFVPVGGYYFLARSFSDFWKCNYGPVNAYIIGLVGEVRFVIDRVKLTFLFVSCPKLDWPEHVK